MLVDDRYSPSECLLSQFAPAGLASMHMWELAHVGSILTSVFAVMISVTARYGMREALAIVAEQGLDAMWKRHTEMGKYLWAGLNEIGLEAYVQDPADRLITVNTIRVPKDIDGVKLIKFAMDKFSLEISAGECCLPGL